MRGLPHCHALITLAVADKPSDARKVDSLISAEIPDPLQKPEIYERVKAHMVRFEKNNSCLRLTTLFRSTALAVRNCALMKRAGVTKSSLKIFAISLTLRLT